MLTLPVDHEFLVKLYLVFTSRRRIVRLKDKNYFRSVRCRRRSIEIEAMLVTHFNFNVILGEDGGGKRQLNKIADEFVVTDTSRLLGVESEDGEGDRRSIR